ncbi:hypothetical protein BC936DRAFT_141879 [Jimgerdemannia flammicorona]|uniref:Uncharacterized protein n=2 Tax=Jimgerdemannia flammicorona TaxID=994334 RepID=A0A433A1G7_9FUNG|nr:hypothetical protein BC936DRAFT_141879 [Jimgerdemannia flammicorona]RUS22417.1 hypothetical protein BC938DRAFT_475247 [Jimgerdemannia flammicorona]
MLGEQARVRVMTKVNPRPLRYVTHVGSSRVLRFLCTFGNCLASTEDGIPFYVFHTLGPARFGPLTP